MQLLPRVPDLVAYLAPLLGIAGVLLALRTVAAGKQREREAVRLAEEAHSIKNDFVAMVSHELRTPLTSIAGFSDTLVHDWRNLPDDEVDEFLSIINRQSQYLGDLVEDVLVIPRLEAGRLRFNPRMFDLGELTKAVADLLFPSGGDKEASVTMPSGVRVMADYLRVQQVLRNLMENARKYGGDLITVEGLAFADQYIVIIADNGPGVPDESIREIFEHFEQISKGDAREASGIGLGLPIARRLARAMGGDVWYERRFPTGSRFCYSMPIKLGGSTVGDLEGAFAAVVEIDAPESVVAIPQPE